MDIFKLNEHVNYTVEKFEYKLTLWPPYIEETVKTCMFIAA